MIDKISGITLIVIGLSGLVGVVLYNLLRPKESDAIRDILSREVRNILDKLDDFFKEKIPINELIWYNWPRVKSEIYVRKKPTRYLCGKSLKILVFYL